MLISGKMVVGTFTKVERRFINMSIEMIKKEVYYYCGRSISDDEAEEILAFAKDCPGAALNEIVEDYYNC